MLLFYLYLHDIFHRLCAVNIQCWWLILASKVTLLKERCRHMTMAFGVVFGVPQVFQSAGSTFDVQ